MKQLPSCHGIIPARYGSTRFPAKALADIGGKPMFWHVWNRASACASLLSVTLATDDERIAAPAAALGVPCVMTSPDHQSGTDRVYEAALALGLPEESVIVNIQGDEPLLDPLMLDQLTAPFRDNAVRVCTLARGISPAEAASPDLVKVVVGADGNALYFSRSVIPYDREKQIPAATANQPGHAPQNASSGSPAEAASAAGHPGHHDYLGHIGLYAFRHEALRAFTSLAPSRLESLEKLEQLRLLENGIPIRVILTDRQSIGVDRPEDLEEVLAILAKK